MRTIRAALPRASAATVTGMTDQAAPADPSPGAADAQTLPADRVKSFADAVVAIAMTLLILPLMESVGSAVDEHLGTAEWLNENSGLLLSFTLSFVLIANFWMTHHRLFARVHQVTNALVWLTIACWLMPSIRSPSEAST